MDLKEVYIMRFLTYYRLLGVFWFLVGMELTFNLKGFRVIKYMGVLLIIVGLYDIITGKSFKNSARENMEAAEKDKDNKESIRDFIRKHKSEKPLELILKILKKNSLAGIITVGISVVIFLSLGPITTSYFSPSKDAQAKNGSAGKNVSADKNSNLSKLTNSKLELDNKQLIISAEEVEQSSEGTYIKLKIDNHGKHALNLTDTSKTTLTDARGNIYELILSGSKNFFSSLEPGNSMECVLHFKRVEDFSNAELKSQLWSTENGITNYPFTLKIKE